MIKNAATLTISVGMLGLRANSTAKRMIKNAGAMPMPNLHVPFQISSAGMIKSLIFPVQSMKKNALKNFSQKRLHAILDKTAGKYDPT
jgi:hypothetical protein